MPRPSEDDVGCDGEEICSWPASKVINPFISSTQDSARSSPHSNRKVLIQKASTTSGEDPNWNRPCCLRHVRGVARQRQTGCTSPEEGFNPYGSLSQQLVIVPWSTIPKHARDTGPALRLLVCCQHINDLLNRVENLHVGTLNPGQNTTNQVYRLPIRRPGCFTKRQLVNQY
jgi:hypothetical protein